MRAWHFPLIAILIAGLGGLIAVGPGSSVVAGQSLSSTTASGETAEREPLDERLPQDLKRLGVIDQIVMAVEQHHREGQLM